jgi:cytochrome P450
MERDEGTSGIAIRFGGRGVHLVGDRVRSDGILSRPPMEGAYTTGALKRSAMAFLAPGAVTIADGERWRRLRVFNEEVLDAVHQPGYAKAFARRVRDAFVRPVRNDEDVRSAMGRAMVGIVLGDVRAGEDPAGDVRTLFAAVQSPVKRKLLGFAYRGRRRRFRAALERRWATVGADEPTLLGRAQERASHHPDLAATEILDQVPHWMFTFTGSGSDLLVRTLALITARPDVLGRVMREIGQDGDAGGSSPTDTQAAEAPTGIQPPFLRACLLEAGRLFPPVTKTFHRRPSAEGGDEIAHWFPLLQRDPALGPSVDAFRPERWLIDELDPAARASNLFLRGPRSCPGEDLILFVCEAAIRHQLGELEMTARPSRLSVDPLPVSFPAGDVAFITRSES